MNGAWSINVWRILRHGALVLVGLVIVACGNGDETTDVATECVRDADDDGFLTLDEYRVGLACAADDFEWPDGMVPDASTFDKLIREFANERLPVRLQQGYEYVTMGGLNECAWNKTWLDAYQRGDTAMAAEALDYMTDVIPNFGEVIPGYPADGAHPTSTNWSRAKAEKAALGDPSLIQEDLTYSCQTLAWLPGSSAAGKPTDGTPP